MLMWDGVVLEADWRVGGSAARKGSGAGEDNFALRANEEEAGKGRPRDGCIHRQNCINVCMLFGPLS